MTVGHLPAVDSKKTPVPEAVGSGWSLPRGPGPVPDREIRKSRSDAHESEIREHKSTCEMQEKAGHFRAVPSWIARAPPPSCSAFDRSASACSSRYPYLFS